MLDIEGRHCLRNRSDPDQPVHSVNPSARYSELSELAAQARRTPIIGYILYKTRKVVRSAVIYIEKAEGNKNIELKWRMRIQKSTKKKREGGKFRP